MTALELHRQNSSLDLAPILRVIKYMGFDSNSLSEAEVDKILRLYHHFERDPELVVGIEAVSQLTELAPERLTEVLGAHRHEIPFLGTIAHPMLPASAVGMIRAVAEGEDPFAPVDEELFTLTEMAERTGISLASLSKYVKEQTDRIPSRLVGKMRKFPRAAIPVFLQIKTENMGRRGNGHDRAERQKAAVSRRYATKFAELESQLEVAVDAAKELTRTLSRLSNQVRRARTGAESSSQAGATRPAQGSRRSGGHRPNTIVAACKQVLAESSGPMRVSDITERVVRMGTTINAKNPNVTVSSILSSYDDFGRVRRGYYELLKRPSPPGSTAAGEAENTADEAPELHREQAAPPLIERDPEDVLAELQAAAQSGEPSGQKRDGSDGSRRRERAKKARRLDLEPFGAAG